MKKLLAPIGVILTLSLILVLLFRVAPETPNIQDVVRVAPIDEKKGADVAPEQANELIPEVAVLEEAEMEEVPVAPEVDQEQQDFFTPEMRTLVRGIEAGQAVQIRVQGEEQTFVFRPIEITTENFQISAGADEEVPSSFAVFEGRNLLADGSLTDSAAMAVVNDTYSIAYTNDEGDFLIQKNEQGELVRMQLRSSNPMSMLGKFTCAIQGNMAGAKDASGNMPMPMDTDVSVTLAGGEEEETPEIGGAVASHPFFRLGPQYDASLKDINVLMVSGSTQTGPASEFNSRASEYFTYIATLRDVYERQLGLRVQLQEMILIADEPGLLPADDVEYDDSVTPNNTSSGGDDLDAVEAWVDINRPRSTYQWGHVMAWTLANSDAGGTVGWAYIDAYGTESFGFSVNEKRWTWGVITHELGHNVGASHTNGGAMNPSVSRSNPREDFFTENEASGGYTGATDIYNYMSGTTSFVTGPAPLRNPIEMPFGVDDTRSTPTDTPITFNPLTNDLTATPLFGQTNTLRLVEVGQVFPKSAGSASVSGNEITFTPTGGYAGNVWFTYTLGGDVGNGGLGWLHSADVIITVGGNSSNPNQNPAISTTDDVLQVEFSGSIRLNPLLNDEGDGRLWAGDVDGIGIINGVTQAGDYGDDGFSLVSATVLTGNGSVSLETTDMTVGGSNTQGNTGYLVYTPGVNEPAQVVIQYTVRDENGLTSTGLIYLNAADVISVASDLTTFVESSGRVANIVISRTGPTTASEWVDFTVTGAVELTGATSDVALAGFDSFDAGSAIGRVTIPAGQSSVTLVASVMSDAVVEGSESLNLLITDSESLLVSGVNNLVSLSVLESSYGAVFAYENFDAFPLNSDLANGWTNDPGQVGVWTADNGPTPSSNTGPDNDRTQGDSSGRYLYREASFGNDNQRADLLSPVIDLSGEPAAELEFYYHMYGGNMGDLQVDVFADGSWNNAVIPVITGQQQTAGSDPWTRVTVDVSDYTDSDFQIRFRGTTGPGFTSDISIDDVTVGRSAPPATESPVLSGQPQSQTVSEGEEVYLSVVAQAYPAPTYQWKKNGVDIPGATQSVLYFGSVMAADQGDYTCEVTSGSTVTSSTATITVPIVPPTNLLVTAGPTSVSLNWDDSGSPILASYSVYRSTTQGSYGAPYQTGVSTSDFVDNGVVDGTTYYYVVTALDTTPSESGFSNEVSIAFEENIAAPEVDAGSDQVVVLTGGAPWSPAALSPAAWYDASDLATITESGGAVSEWRDKSGNDYHLTQGDGTRQPQLGAFQINGIDAVKFDGSNDQLGASANPFEPTVEDAFVIAVHRHDGNVNGTLFTLSGSTGSGNRWQAHVPWGGTVYFDTGGTGGGARVSASYGVSVGDEILVSFYGSTTDNVQQVHKNGTLLVGDSSGHSVTTPGNLVLGSGNGSQYQNTSVAEVVILDGAVPPETRQLLEGYLAHKWGQEGNLPNGHPYENDPPGGGGVVVALDGTVTDADGGTPTTTWTVFSGPGAVTFDDDSAVDTNATFTEAGVYVLRLTADDGLNQVSSDVTITVNEADADGDGMDDAWELAVLGTTSGNGSGDLDANGITDYFQYIYGDVDGTYTGFTFVVAPTPSATGVRYTWTVQSDFILGTDYILEASTDLSTPGSWSTLVLDAEDTLTETPDVPNNKTQIDLELDDDLGSPVYLRLRNP